MVTIGQRIRQLRKAKGLTQPVLAKAVGIDQSTLSDIERGAGFSAEILMSLSDELDTTAEFIMRGMDALSPRVQAARRVVSELTDEERLALLSAIQQEPVSDQEVERHFPKLKELITTPPAKKATKKKKAA